MADSSKNTGTGGQLIIRDNSETSYVEFLLDTTEFGGIPTPVNQIPWAVTVNGATTWYTVNYPAYRSDPVLLHTAFVTTSQLVTLQIGVSNSAVFGGPTSLTTSIRRGEEDESLAQGVGYIRDGVFFKASVPYVKDDGVWKATEPWVKHEGKWERAT